MSEAQKQIRANRADVAIQRMNRTLVDSDTPHVASENSGELPLFGEQVQKVIQNLKPEAGAK